MLNKILEMFNSKMICIKISGIRSYGTLKFYGTNKVYSKRGSINIEKHASLCINKSFRNNELQKGFLELNNRSSINVKGKFRIHNGNHIILMNGAKLNLGSGYINRNVKIRCFNEITIGNNVAISENVSIWDSDAHHIDRFGYKETEPITSGNNVCVDVKFLYSFINPTASSVLLLKPVSVPTAETKNIYSKMFRLSIPYSLSLNISKRISI